MTFIIADSETNEKVKDMKFTIVAKYGEKMEEKSCTSDNKGRCNFKLNVISLRTGSVKIGFAGTSGNRAAYDGSNNINHKGCKVFSEDCLTFDIMAPA